MVCELVQRSLKGCFSEAFGVQEVLGYGVVADSCAECMVYRLSCPVEDAADLQDANP